MNNRTVHCSKIGIAVIVRITFFMALALAAELAFPRQLFALPDTPATKERCKNDACFKPTLQLGDTRLPLRGIANLRYLIFNLYVAALYAPQDANTSDKLLADLPKCLVLSYLRSISREDLIESTKELIAEDPTITEPEVANGFAKLYEAYQDVHEGDRYMLCYDRTKGTSLSLNGTQRMLWPGLGFQKVVFGIWLAANGSKPEFTKQLIQNE